MGLPAICHATLRCFGGERGHCRQKTFLRLMPTISRLLSQPMDLFPPSLHLIPGMRGNMLQSRLLPDPLVLLQVPRQTQFHVPEIFVLQRLVPR